MADQAAHLAANTFIAALRSKGPDACASDASLYFDTIYQQFQSNSPESGPDAKQKAYGNALAVFTTNMGALAAENPDIASQIRKVSAATLAHHNEPETAAAVTTDAAPAHPEKPTTSPSVSHTESAATQLFSERPTLKLGRGSDHKAAREEIQQMLIAKGFLAPLDKNGRSNVDGNFQGLTQAAIIRFQTQQGHVPTGVMTQGDLQALATGDIAHDVPAHTSITRGQPTQAGLAQRFAATGNIAEIIGKLPANQTDFINQVAAQLANKKPAIAPHDRASVVAMEKLIGVEKPTGDFGKMQTEVSQFNREQGLGKTSAITMETLRLAISSSALTTLYNVTANDASPASTPAAAAAPVTRSKS